jgi:hypothetical protein
MHACVYFCTVSLALFGGMLTCSQALPVETVPMERLESAVDEDRYAWTPIAHLSSLQSPLLIGWLSRSTWSKYYGSSRYACVCVLLHSKPCPFWRNVDVQPGTPGRNGANGAPGERGRRGPVCVYTYCPSFISSISLTNRLAFAVHLVKVLRELQVCMRVCTSAQ